MNIEAYVKQEGEKIAKAIIFKYGPEPVVEHKSFFGSFFDGLLGGGYSRIKVESDIYQRSLHEATSFFLKNGESKFDEKILETLKSRMRNRLKKPAEADKMNPEELLANVIKICTADSLLDNDFVL